MIWLVKIQLEISRIEFFKDIQNTFVDILNWDYD